MALSPGTLLRGRYDVLRNTNNGGMSTVFEAIDKRLADSQCAVKELLDTKAAGTAADYVRSTFELEMKALVELDHPCIPKVRDFFHEGDKTYLVMDFLPGRNLQQELEEHMETTRRAFPAGKAVTDILAVLEIVSYLHGQTPSIVHRDIKPANIIRDEKSGRLKLVDFGLARTLLDKSTLPSRVGTLGYCAPEQLAGCADQRSDIYSVGATFHFLMTGQPPRLGADVGRADIPADLYPIVARATAPRASERYGKVQELIADLTAWQAGATSHLPVRAVVKTVTQPAALKTRRPSRRNAWFFLATMAMGMGWVGGQLFWKSTPQPALVETWNPPTETVLTSLGLEPLRPYEAQPGQRHILRKESVKLSPARVSAKAIESPNRTPRISPRLSSVVETPTLAQSPMHRPLTPSLHERSTATLYPAAPSLGEEAYPRAASVSAPAPRAAATPIAQQRPATAPAVEAPVSHARETVAPAVAVSVDAAAKSQPAASRFSDSATEVRTSSEYPGLGGPGGGGPSMGGPGGGPGGHH